MIECKSYKQVYLIPLCLFCITLILVDGAAAQSRGLSRITPQQITKLMQLPQEFAAYDVVAECEKADKANSLRCDERDLKVVQAKTVFSVSEQGKVITHQCSQGRLFRFEQKVRVWLFVSLCQDGPLVMPALLDTKAANERLSQLFFDGLARGTTRPNPFGEFASQRTVKLNAEETIYMFSLVLPGHGFGFAPTAVVASSRQNDTLVVQFLFVPEKLEIDDPNNPEARLMPRPTEILEVLAKELSQTTR
jgi:hypothetical protein